MREKKREIVESTFSADLERLSAAALKIARADWRTRDLSPRQLREALASVTTALGVYRTYRTAATLNSPDERVFAEAVQSARISAPNIIGGSAFDFLAVLFSKPQLDAAEEDFIAGWQQLAPAVMAKGVEDTTFYLFDRLVSCNEVGSQASLMGISAEKFHEFCHYLSDRWPNNMLATSTHDNKRSEDVRTRISLLSEIPDRWAEALHQWSQLTAAAWNNRTPDRHAEYLLYQTLIGAWPLSQERCWQYMLKACREAKVRTSWHEPNTGYEENIRGFVDGVYRHAGVHREPGGFHRAPDPARARQLPGADAHQDDRSGRAGFLPGKRAVGSESRRPGQSAARRFRPAHSDAQAVPLACGGRGRRRTGTAAYRSSG